MLDVGHHIEVSSFVSEESAIGKTSECYRFIPGGKEVGAKSEFLEAFKLFYTEGEKEEEGEMTLIF